MSADPIPKNFNEYTPALLWGVFAFASGFEGVVMLFEGHFLLAALGIVGAFALTALAANWGRVSTALPTLGSGFNALASDARTWVGAIFLILAAAILSPFVEQHRWPFIANNGPQPPRVVYEPPTADDIAKAVAPFQFKSDEAAKQRDVAIAERDSARRELANTRQDLEAAKKTGRAPAQTGTTNQPNADGPLNWEPNLLWGASGTGKGLIMSFVYFRATNVSSNAVQLKDAYISSG